MLYKARASQIAKLENPKRSLSKFNLNVIKIARNVSFRTDTNVAVLKPGLLNHIIGPNFVHNFLMKTDPNVSAI